MSSATLKANGWTLVGNVWRNLELEVANPSDVGDVFTTIARNLAKTRAYAAKLDNRTCGRCGCLVRPAEVCPGCHAALRDWCLDQEVLWSWNPIPYNPARAEEVAAA